MITIDSVILALNSVWTQGEDSLNNLLGSIQALKKLKTTRERNEENGEH